MDQRFTKIVRTLRQMRIGAAGLWAVSLLPFLAGPSLAFEVCASKDLHSVAVGPADAAGLFHDADGQPYFAAEVHSKANDAPPLAGIAVFRATLSAYPLGPPNRWGQRPAWIVGTSGTTRFLLQAELLENGRAVYMPKLSTGGCAGYLRQMERNAERSGLGLWQDGKQLPVYSAAVPDALLKAAGRYVIVRGRIVSLGKTRSTRYLNFGRYWKKDFTVTLANKDTDDVLAAVTDDGWSFEELAGRIVEIRGVIDVRDGPLIAWHRAEQLVVLEEKRAGRDVQNQN